MRAPVTDRRRLQRTGLRAGLLSPALAWALSGAAAGCGSNGSGQLEGSLFLRGCEAQDPTPRGSSQVPSPLPSFVFDPAYFYGEVYRQYNSPLRHEGETIDRMRVRIQRGSEKPERADVFEILVLDMSRALREQEQALARGEPGFPILPPPVSGATVPLPGDPYASARAALSLHASCSTLMVQPQLRGHVRFIELGRELGEWIEAEVDLTAEDARATREQGGMPQAVDTAGALKGRFRLQLRTGPAVNGI
jgi:hypothetical protein